mgnify:CR=1 FL=1
MKAKGSLTKQEAEVEVSKEEINAFFNGIVPEFVKEGGGIISDTVRFWRWKNQIKLIKKAEKIIEDNNLTKQQIPLKVLAPLIENSSYEEDESMQNRWANLLSNAVTGQVNVTPNFVEILKELSPLEAIMLDKVYDETIAQTGTDVLQFSKEKICEWLKLSSDDFDLMIENLYRLGLCQRPGSTGIMFGNARVALHTTELFELTTLGRIFVRACREPVKTIA